MKSNPNLTTLAAGLLFAAMGLSLATAADNKKDEAKSDTVMVETYTWYPYPLYLETNNWFHNAEMSFRQKEEKAAAGELRKAVSWLDYAASHAQPVTKKSLQDASASLKTLATNLQFGNVVSARSLDVAMAKSSHALAEWHYFNAKDSKLAKNEENWAAQNLKAAAAYLKSAADSARYEYGDEFISVYDDIFGWEEIDFTPNTLATNLSAIKVELDKVAKALEKGDS